MKKILKFKGKIIMKNLSRQKITESEKKKYVMPTRRDYEILFKVKQLEKLNLSKSEKLLVKLIRTQLERDWRKWLIKELDKILLKYIKTLRKCFMRAPK